MIYDSNPEDQLEECLDGLVAVKYAIENKDVCNDSSLPSHLQQIEWSLKDAITRIKQNHKAELDRAWMNQPQSSQA